MGYSNKCLLDTLALKAQNDMAIRNVLKQTIMNVSTSTQFFLRLARKVHELKMECREMAIIV